MSWFKERQKHSLASRGVKTKPIIFQCCGEQKKIEYVKLISDVYSKNKDKIKKLFKEEGLLFNRGEYLTNGKFVWENNIESIELVMEEDSAVLRWESGNKTTLYEKLKVYTSQLGGIWSTKKIEPTKTKEELDKFDSKFMNKFIQHERNARIKGFKHCPILVPMIKEYVEQRKEYDEKNISVIEVARKVNEQVDKMKVK